MIFTLIALSSFGCSHPAPSDDFRAEAHDATGYSMAACLPADYGPKGQTYFGKFTSEFTDPTNGDLFVSTGSLALITTHLYDKRYNCAVLPELADEYPIVRIKIDFLAPLEDNPKLTVLYFTSTSFAQEPRMNAIVVPSINGQNYTFLTALVPPDVPVISITPIPAGQDLVPLHSECDGCRWSNRLL